MSGIAFIIQFKDLAGPASWVTGVVTLFCIGIGILAIFKGEKTITKSDWISFALAISAIPVWLLTSEPLLAVFVIVLIELLNYYPTIRKSYKRPWDEDLLSWALSALRWFFASLAVSHITLESLLYPAFITACEISTVIYLVWRRKVLTKDLQAHKKST